MPKGGGAIRGHRREVRRQPGDRHRVDDRAHRHQPRPLRLRPAAFALLRLRRGQRPFGFGWVAQPALRSPARPTKGLPQYHDAEESDVFILSGAEDLVPVCSNRTEWDPERCHDDAIGTGLHHPPLPPAHRRAVRPHRALDPPERRRCPLALHLQRQHPHPLRQGRELPHRRPRRSHAHLHLADLRDPRRQGQRRSLRVQTGGRRRRRSDPAPTSATGAIATTPAARPTAISSASATATACHCWTTRGTGRAC